MQANAPALELAVPAVRYPDSAAGTAVHQIHVRVRPQRVSEQPLVALLSAVGCARRFAGHTLRMWRLDRPAALAETVDRVVSALVTSAVHATGITVERPRALDLCTQRLNLVIVRLSHIETSLVIEVWDTDPHPPAVPDLTLERQGRSDLCPATAWNYYHPPAGGKVVWTQLQVPPADALDDTHQLPITQEEPLRSE
jgi:hypothetical protein